MEHLRPQFPDSLQDLLVERYCVEAKDLLEQARDREEGERISREFCARMARECRSSLVVTASRMYVGALLNEKWGGGSGNPADRPSTSSSGTGR